MFGSWSQVGSNPLDDIGDDNYLEIKSKSSSELSIIAVEYIENGDFENGLSYWDTYPSGDWEVRVIQETGGTNAAYVEKELEEGPTEYTAWIAQNFTLPSETSWLYLSLNYTAWLIGGKEQFRRVVLTVYILDSSGGVVEEEEIFRRDFSGKSETLIDTFTYNFTGPYSPGTYTLKFVLYAQTKPKKGGTVKLALDNISLKGPQKRSSPIIGLADYLALVKVDLEPGSSYIRANCTLLVEANTSVGVEIYNWTGRLWMLTSKYLVLSASTFNVTFEGDALLLFYSSTPFSIKLDYLGITIQVMSDIVRVVVTNDGDLPVELYAIWLRNSSWSSRVGDYTILFPGETMTVSFDTALTSGTIYEVRAVTTHKVYSSVVEP